MEHVVHFTCYYRPKFLGEYNNLVASCSNIIYNPLSWFIIKSILAFSFKIVRLPLIFEYQRIYHGVGPASCGLLGKDISHQGKGLYKALLSFGILKKKDSLEQY